LQVFFTDISRPKLTTEQAHVELPLSLLQPPTVPAAGNAAASSSTTGNSIIVPVKKEKKKYHLSTTTDPLLAELRDLNFASVGKKLNQVAHRLDEDYKVGSLFINSSRD
jgi:hypothetical protein